MGDVNFYLKKSDSNSDQNNDKCLIYLQFRYKGKKVVFTFNRSIEPKYWNNKKHRTKSIFSIPKEYQNLNTTLEEIKKECERAYDFENKNGVIPMPEQIKAHLIKFINQNDKVKSDKPTLLNLMDRFIAGEIKHQGKNKAEGTIVNYRQVKKHIAGFELKYRCKVDFENITLDFFYKFTNYLSKVLDLKTNTIAKEIKVLKVFMNEALDLGYTTNVSFKNKKFTVGLVDTDSVALSRKEILKLYKFDLSEYPHLETVRDLFVFGCCVGLRYSDYSQVKPENITEVNGVKYLSIRPKKTPNVSVKVPCDNIVLEIFKKYKKNPNMLPVAKQNQPFNKDIKEACLLAGFTEKGRLVGDPTKELYKCITSHTARRSFATNYYLEGFPAYTLMKITGHKTEASFLKYLKLSSTMAAEKLHEHQKQHEWVLTKE